MGWCGSKLENVEYPSRQVSLRIIDGRVICKFIHSTLSQVQMYLSNLLRKEQAKRIITEMPRTLRKCRFVQSKLSWRNHELRSYAMN